MAQPAQFRRIIKALSSLKLAVIVIACLATITAWGTFVEARFNDSAAARRIVYHSPYMYGIMGLLAINLIAVMIDRWPWQKKHLGFVFAHIGILILMAGALTTQLAGVDGSLSIGIGESSDSITVDDKDLTVYSSMTGERYTVLYDYAKEHNSDADFSRLSLKDTPILVSVPDGEIEIVDHLPYALRDEKIVASERSGDGPAIRFQMQNARVNLVEWLLQSSHMRPAVKDLGPAKIVLVADSSMAKIDPSRDGNVILLTPNKNSAEVAYTIYTKSNPHLIKKGKVKVGSKVETGWMGLTFKLLKLLPQAKEDVTFKPLDKATPLTTEAIKLIFTNTLSHQRTEYWLGLNSLVKLFSEQAVYIVSYANRRVKLPVPFKLSEFKLGHYQGTDRASSYESVVNVPGLGERTISMNEPLKYAGYTFYQSSFSNDEQGRPLASVFSVNNDPGRWIKYLGSLIIVLGIITMFYFKKRMKQS